MVKRKSYMADFPLDLWTSKLQSQFQVSQETFLEIGYGRLSVYDFLFLNYKHVWDNG